MFRPAFRFLFLAFFLAIYAAAASANGVPIIYQPLNPSAVAPGGVGFTLTVSGTGFTSSAVVNWSGNPRTTTFLSSSKLSASISTSDIASPGAALITVTNPGSGGGTSNAISFQITNPVSETPFANNDVSGPRSNLATVASGDFNADGKLDLVTAIGSNIFVLPGNGDGTFGAPIASGGPNATIGYIFVTDLNGDGKPDLVLVTSTGTFTALGKGDGTFQLTGSSLSDAPLAAILADFNGDGNVDMAYATISGIQVQFGNGDGPFRPGPFTPFAQSYPGSRALAAGDFNQDGMLDLVVVTSAGNCIAGTFTLVIYPGNGDGSFATPAPVQGVSTCGIDSPPSATVADFNGDGKLDITYFTQTGTFGSVGYFTVSLGNGDGTFQVPLHVLPTNNTVAGPLSAGDLNGDGKLDLIAGNQLFNGNGDGTFTGVGVPSSNLDAVLAGDFNGDGKLDLISVSGNTPDIRILLQLAPPADFGGSVTPSLQQIVPGGSTSFTVNVSALNGFTGDVSLSVSGLPSGVTGSFSPNAVTGGSGTSTLTLTASSSVPLGNYSLTITGTSGSLSHSLPANLIVNSSLGDFTGTVQPNPQNIIAGNSGSYTITISPTGGYNGSVNLSHSGLPPGSSATLNPTTILGASGSATLTVFTATSTAQNVYPITISATSGPLSHSTAANLGVRSSTPDWNASISPSSQSAAVGSTASYAITVVPANGFSADLTITADGLPPGATSNAPIFAFSPYNGLSLSVSLPPGTQPGTYQLLVTGKGGGVIHQGVVTLNVTP